MSNTIQHNLLILNVFAKPNSHFASYDLIQAISGTGMQYGEMNIFHYHETTLEGRVRLFSLASATEPGEFYLDRMGDFTCAGLTLFMDLRHVLNPFPAFQKMLSIAEQLAEDLEGELFNAALFPWNTDILEQYYQKILDYRSNPAT